MHPRCINFVYESKTFDYIAANMRIAKLFAGPQPAYSFEFFPPKTPQGEESLYRTIDNLRALQPSFVSVTYGAGGSTQEKTVELVSRIKHDIGIESMAHLTCVGADRQQIRTVLQRLRDIGIENVLALRGDPPRGEASFRPPLNGFAYAAQLVSFIREQGFEFCVGGAGYPEGHIECTDRERDLQHLKEKVQAGTDFVITQLFFDNADYFSFVDKARRLGITVPIIPGIMPITNASQIERLSAMCGARIPGGLRSALHAAGEDEAQVRQIGIEYATEQCQALLAGGVRGIHFYTLNQSPATRAIVERLRG